VSFILDALRKSEHERQRSSLPALSQVPLATVPAHLPRWALVVIGVLATAVVALGGAWWQSGRAPSEPSEAAVATVERTVELPPPSTPAPQSPRTAPPADVERAPRPGQDVAAPPARDSLASAAATTAEVVDEPASSPVDDRPALPSAAALAAEGIVMPELRLTLHAFGERPRDRYVFINGRKYVEGERLAEGPQLESIDSTGVVLIQAGRRFLLRPE
jgi:general secretion pathway protein B